MNQRITRSFSPATKIFFISACFFLAGLFSLYAQPCTSSATSNLDGDIGNVTVNGATNISTCSTTGGGASIQSSYADYTSMGALTTLQTGSSVQFSVGIITCGSVVFQYGIGVYIDFNRNGSLTDPGEQVYVTLAGTPMTQAGNTLTASFNVPNTIVSGSALMRIVAVESTSGAAINPCGTYAWGETEDYTVMLGSPITATITDASCNGTDGAINISFSGNTAPYTYLWSNGATTEDIQGLSSGAYTVVVTDANGIAVQNTFYVNSSNLAANENLTIPACFAANGAITLNPSGGTTPYAYQWNNGQTASSLQNIMAGGYSVNITDSNGCFLHKAFNLALSTNCYVQIGGKAYYDVNNNCVWDAGEVGVPYTSLHLTKPNSNNYYAGTITPSGNGDYLVVSDTGNYVLHANLPSSYMSINCPSGNNYTLPMPNYGTDSLGIDFPISIPSVQDLVVTLAENVYVPGFNHHTYINYRNAGTIATPATLTYHYNNVLTFLNFSLPYTSIDTVNHIMTWNLGNLAALSAWEQIHITAHLDTPQVMGNPVPSEVHISPVANDFVPANNEVIHNAIIMAAYDPNIKEVSPIGIAPHGLVDASTDKFHYTIHFQNTGNYMAQFVIVKDSIPASLDIQSIEFEGSSHNCVVSMANERQLVFTFNDIFLPDSTTNEPESHGYVSFALKTKPNTPAFTELYNKAAIYFDFNVPVITNEVKNVLYVFPSLSMLNQVTVCETDNVSTNIAGGKAPYNFVWSNGNADNNNVSGTSAQVASTLQAGTNSVTATDIYGYSISQNFNLTTVSPANAAFAATLTAPNTYQFTPNNTTYATYAWDFGNGQTSNLVSPTQQYPFAGTYNVTLTVENLCGAVSENKTLDITTGVEDLQQAVKVKTYPNPFSDFVMFDFPNDKGETFAFELRDASGKLVYSQNTQDSHLKIATDKLASGTYFWKWNKASGSIQK